MVKILNSIATEFDNFCSCSFNPKGGHDNASTNSLPTGFQLDISESVWTSIPEMNVPRRDHACLFVEFEKTKGILVTGGN